MNALEETEGSASYRPVSAMAVASVAAGGLSALAIVSPLLWVLPLVGMALAIVAIADVNREGAKKAGRLLALVGLALSVGFGSQAVSATVMGHWLASTRATAAARLWIEAIQQGRLKDAKSMCEPEAMQAVEAIAACGPRAACALRCEGAVEERAGSWLVRATVGPCLVAPDTPTESPAASLALAIVLESTVSAQQGRASERWTIIRCDF